MTKDDFSLNSLFNNLKSLSGIRKIRGMFPELTKAEEKQLASVIHDPKSDKCEKENAKFHLIVSGFEVLLYRLRGYTKDPNIEARISDGFLALCLAADKFDPGKDTCFSTYANYWINQVISRNNGKENVTLKPGRQVGEDFLKIFQLEQETAKKMGHSFVLSSEDISEQLGMPLKKVRRLRNSCGNLNRIQSAPEQNGFEGGMNEPWDMKTESPDSFIDDDIEGEETKKVIREELARLPELQRRIMEMVCNLDGEGKRTKTEIAQKLQITKPRLNREIENAKNVLRRNLSLQDAYYVNC